MANRGGHREGSGRKAKATELELIERLSPLDDDAMKALKSGIKKGEYPYVKMFFEYRLGKPKETMNLKHEGSINVLLSPTDDPPLSANQNS